MYIRKKGEEVGFVYVTVRVAHYARPGRDREVELLVDTGAVMSVIPRRVLEELGTEPIRKRRFQGFGGSIDRDVGSALIQYSDDITVAPVVFGEEDDTPVLGVTALETLGYKVNPSTGELERTELLLL